MISICIPIYNYNVTPLVNYLHIQGEVLSVPFEIILIDDASNEEYKRINEQISLEKVKYIPLKENIGRAKIRNRFLKYAQYDYLLFLDCDSAIISEDFLEKYTSLISKINTNVIYGGRIYGNERPKREKLLRWKYGIKKESKPASIRELFPNKSFMTNNFVIRKDILCSYPFEETIAGYGHEDTLFGFQLKKHKIPILNIENPILNDDIEDNDEFLRKTEEGIKNLVYILDLMNNDPLLIEDIRIASTFEKLKSKNAIWAIRCLYLIGKPVLKFLLQKGYFSLWMFDAYKIGLFIQEKNK